MQELLEICMDQQLGLPVAEVFLENFKRNHKVRLGDGSERPAQKGWRAHNWKQLQRDLPTFDAAADPHNPKDCLALVDLDQVDLDPQNTVAVLWILEVAAA